MRFSARIDLHMFLPISVNSHVRETVIRGSLARVIRAKHETPANAGNFKEEAISMEYLAEWNDQIAVLGACLQSSFRHLSPSKRIHKLA